MEKEKLDFWAGKFMQLVQEARQAGLTEFEVMAILEFTKLTGHLVGAMDSNALDDDLVDRVAKKLREGHIARE